MKRHIYWQETERVSLRPGLRGDVSCDVCLIGGGYTSLWTSLMLKAAEPSLDIRILEADYVGAGASGHNDGFVTTTIGHSLSVVVSQFGVEASKEAYAALGLSILELIRFCEKNGIDAEIEKNGFYLVATSEAQLRRLDHDVELAAQFGGRSALRVLDAAEMRTRVPSPVIRGGIAAGGALINPFKLVRGLARVAEAQGVVISDQSRVTDVTTEAGRQVVTTTRGRVTADHVVFATNAYQPAFADFRSSVVPVWSYALVSEPLTDEQLERSEWVSRQGFVEARNFILFGRLTGENRILFGGGPAPCFLGLSTDPIAHLRNDKVEGILRREFRRFLPQMADLRWSHFYGGPIAMTRRLVPQVGTLRPGWHFAHGYCGNGIASTHLAAKSLGDLIRGKDSRYTNLFFVSADQPKVPPAPLTYVGVRSLSGALAAQDRFPHLLRWPRLSPMATDTIRTASGRET